jgi:hypothetical protein
MNKHSWGGIVIWGVCVTCFGLSAIIATSILTDSSGSAAPDQEAIFLLAGGIVTCLVGLIGMIGSMGWNPGLTSNLAP